MMHIIINNIVLTAMVRAILRVSTCFSNGMSFSFIIFSTFLFWIINDSSLTNISIPLEFNIIKKKLTVFNKLRVLSEKEVSGTYA